MSAAKEIKSTGGPAGPSVVVGLRRVAMFPSENIHGAHRWVAVLEDEDGDWYRCIIPRRKPEIEERMP